MVYRQFWEEKKKKGIRDFLLKQGLISDVGFESLGFCFFIKDKRFFGFENGEIFLFALVMGFATGVLTSIIGCGINNDRYENLKEKGFQYRALRVSLKIPPILLTIPVTTT